jgi:hypothetical protein
LAIERAGRREVEAVGDRRDRGTLLGCADERQNQCRSQHALLHHRLPRRRYAPGFASLGAMTRLTPPTGYTRKSR